MRLANLNGRAVLCIGGQDGGPAAYDIAKASDGQFGPDLPWVYERWEAFRTWADTFEPSGAGETIDRSRLGAPSPAPRQALGIGLNYADHAAESGLGTNDGLPPVFAKFASSISGPYVTVDLPAAGHTDWEVELVVVIGTTTRRVAEADAWDYVAGLTVGQDLSERIGQMQGVAPQFGLAKSHRGFGPTGPWVITVDELEANGCSRDDLALGCAIDGDTVQDNRTGNLIFPVARLISELSSILTLYPGDLIFTGTPAGVGLGCSPQRFLRPGERLRSWIEGVGEIEQDFIDASNSTENADDAATVGAR
ncbi:fumarylacetoacetate hydrolase family protein [Amycolatopsis ultiminotia]|uniref:Fumarylacetoacetate hydrolase family protein n=1 Tax=Amycolatopsis ultiminotia TaxID=543629 RepID=A0ABP6WGL6_9PSEU